MLPTAARQRGFGYPTSLAGQKCDYLSEKSVEGFRKPFGKKENFPTGLEN